MTVDGSTAIDAAFAYLYGLVATTMLLVFSLIYGVFPGVGSIAAFQAALMGSLVVGGAVVGIPLYRFIRRYDLGYAADGEGRDR